MLRSDKQTKRMSYQYIKPTEKDAMHLTTAMLPSEQTITKTGIEIGCKFNGAHEHRDSKTGVFFHVMPPIEGQALKLMVSIGDWRKAEHDRVRREVREGGYTDKDVQPWPQPEHGTQWTR